MAKYGMVLLYRSGDPFFLLVWVLIAHPPPMIISNDQAIIPPSFRFLPTDVLSVLEQLTVVSRRPSQTLLMWC